MCDSDSVFDPVEVIFDDEPYDVLVYPEDELRELPFCETDEPQITRFHGDGHDHG